MAITLTKEARATAIGSIRRYFRESMDDEIGELKAGLLLDFFLKEISPLAYNKGVADAQVYLRERLADLDGACYEPEFGYWK